MQDPAPQEKREHTGQLVLQPPPLHHLGTKKGKVGCGSHCTLVMVICYTPNLED